MIERRIYWVLTAFLVLGAALWANDKNLMTSRMTLDEIANYRNVCEVVKVADARKIPHARQSSEELGSAAARAECKQLGAVGRLLLSCPSLKGDATIYVSFFVDGEDHVLGSSIIIEKINVP